MLENRVRQIYWDENFNHTSSIVSNHNIHNSIELEFVLLQFLRMPQFLRVVTVVTFSDTL